MAQQPLLVAQNVQALPETQVAPIPQVQTNATLQSSAVSRKVSGSATGRTQQPISEQEDDDYVGTDEEIWKLPMQSLLFNDKVYLL